MDCITIRRELTELSVHTLPLSATPTILRSSSLSSTSTTSLILRCQAYNSIFNPDSLQPTTRLLGNFPLLPLRTKVRGPAYALPPTSLPLSESPEPDDESYDAIDEVLGLFRANTFFRNFEIRGPADRLLVYGILWVSECLGKVRAGMSQRYVERIFLCLEKHKVEGMEGRRSRRDKDTAKRDRMWYECGVPGRMR